MWHLHRSESRKNLVRADAANATAARNNRLNTKHKQCSRRTFEFKQWTPAPMRLRYVYDTSAHSLTGGIDAEESTSRGM